jgi:hypothetical protein
MYEFIQSLSLYKSRSKFTMFNFYHISNFMDKGFHPATLHDLNLYPFVLMPESEKKYLIKSKLLFSVEQKHCF